MSQPDRPDVAQPDSRAPSEGSIGRRQLLAGAGALAGLALAGPASAGSHEHHAGHGAAKVAAPKTHKTHAKLVAAAGECVRTGQVCISHCLDTFRAGDTMMADCAWQVEQMLPVCEAFAALATYDSAHLREMASVCAKVCEDCETECRKHEKDFPECKDCADACAELIRQLRALEA